MRRLQPRNPRRALIGSLVAPCFAAALAGCALLQGETSTPIVGDAELVDPPQGVPDDANIAVQCNEITQEDCEQAVSAIVNGLPTDDVIKIELGPLEERLAITPEPAWSASARAVMSDGFEYELVIYQEVRPGPMEINFAPED